MKITYSDSIGIVTQEVAPAWGIDFNGGYAYFDIETQDNYKSVSIPVENILSIEN